MSDQTAGGIERGMYLAADSPRTFVPLALEGGDGDEELLAEAVVGILSGDDVDNLISELISHRVADGKDGTWIKCEDCQHVRETSEKYPTLVNCKECGSYNLRYVDTETDQHEDGEWT